MGQAQTSSTSGSGTGSSSGNANRGQGYMQGHGQGYPTQQRYEFVSPNQQGQNINQGGGGNKNVGMNPMYNPNQNPYQIPNQNVNQPLKKYKANFSTNDLLEAFRNYSIDGKYLNHARFNDSIEKLFSRVDIPSMHYTFLSEKIYYLLDESRDGKISEEEYVNGMKNVLTNKDFRLKLSMMAMMTRPEERNYIEFNEICEFFFKSWVYGYKHLGWHVKRDRNELSSKGIPTPTITQFELWANKFENHIRIYLINDFRECGLDPNRPIDFEAFKKWIYRDHLLRLTYAIKNITIATSLIGLDELGFDESSSNPNIFRYPTFNSK